MLNVSKKWVLLIAMTFVFALMVSSQQQTEETIKCPVMGHEIKDLEKAPSYEYEGKTYYFCCEGCKEKFMKDPEKYLQKKEEMVQKMHEHKEMQEHKEMHAHKEMQEHKEMKMHKEEKACCAMAGLLHSKDVKMDVENVENGIAVKFTSENADVVKKLQEMGPHMKEMHEKMEGCSKKEAKKEVEKEVKKEVKK